MIKTIKDAKKAKWPVFREIRYFAQNPNNGFLYELNGEAHYEAMQEKWKRKEPKRNNHAK